MRLEGKILCPLMIVFTLFFDPHFFVTAAIKWTVRISTLVITVRDIQSGRTTDLKILKGHLLHAVSYKHV